MFREACAAWSNGTWGQGRVVCVGWLMDGCEHQDHNKISVGKALIPSCSAWWATRHGDAHVVLKEVSLQVKFITVPYS